MCVKLTENCVGNILGKYLRRKKENSALAEQRVYLKWHFSSGLENEEGPELIKKKMYRNGNCFLIFSTKCKQISTYRLVEREHCTYTLD